MPRWRVYRNSKCPLEKYTCIAALVYAVSQRQRKLIEQGFGWAKTVGRTRALGKIRLQAA